MATSQNMSLRCKNTPVVSSPNSTNEENLKLNKAHEGEKRDS
jgi:hypothetical protein